MIDEKGWKALKVGDTIRYGKFPEDEGTVVVGEIRDEVPTTTGPGRIIRFTNGFWYGFLDMDGSEVVIDSASQEEFYGKISDKLEPFG